jgi:hypothetical protein
MSLYVKYHRKKFAPFHAMKGYRGVEVQLHSFSTLALDEGQLSTSCSGRFTPERNAGTHLTGDWVSSRASLDVLEKRKIS